MDKLLCDNLDVKYHNAIDKLDSEEKKQLLEVIDLGGIIKYLEVVGRKSQFVVNKLRIEFSETFPKNFYLPFLTELNIRSKNLPHEGFYLPELKVLKISYATIPNLSFLNNHKKLFKLYLNHCGLTTVPELNEFPYLWFLNLSSNNLSSLKGFEKVINCRSLQKLILVENKISDVCEFKPLSHLSELQEVDLRFNEIKELKITNKVPSLTELNLHHNQIQKITALKNLSNLKKIGLSNNNLTELNLQNFENLPNLEKIFIDNNPIKNISGLEFISSNLEIRYVSPENFSEHEIESFKSYLRSIGWRYDEHIIYKPQPPQAEFKINDYLILRLEDGDVNLYINDEVFDQCAILLLTIPADNQYSFNNIASIDESAELFEDQTLSEAINAKIPKETLFWGHASNLQAWYEHNYDTRLLHSNFAFPLLRRLTEVGDPIAKRVFKEEIARRYASGYPSVVEFLKEEGYLNYLSKDELLSLEK